MNGRRVVAVFGLNGIWREQNGEVRGAVDVFVENSLFYLQVEQVLEWHNRPMHVSLEYQYTESGGVSSCVTLRH